MLDGAARVGDLMSEVKAQGMPAIAMTDHGNVFGAFEFYKAAKKADVKPIIGIEAIRSQNLDLIRSACSGQLVEKMMFQVAAHIPT